MVRATSVGLILLAASAAPGYLSAIPASPRWRPQPAAGSCDSKRPNEAGCARASGTLFTAIRSQGYAIQRPDGRIPALVYSLAKGDPSLLTDSVQDIYNALSSGFTAMQFAISCSDGWSSGRRQLALEQASHSVFGDAPFVHLDPHLCGEMAAPGAPRDSLLPFWSSVPTLLVTGTPDSNTPGSQGEEVLWGLAHGGSLLVENGFHETLPSPEVQAVVTEFFSGVDIRRRVIEFPPPLFLTVEEAKTPRPGQ
jgi:hypothetical protein